MRNSPSAVFQVILGGFCILIGPEWNCLEHFVGISASIRGEKEEKRKRKKRRKKTWPWPLFLAASFCIFICDTYPTENGPVNPTFLVKSLGGPCHFSCVFLVLTLVESPILTPHFTRMCSRIFPIVLNISPFPIMISHQFSPNHGVPSSLSWFPPYTFQFFMISPNVSQVVPWFPQIFKNTSDFQKHIHDFHDFPNMFSDFPEFPNIFPTFFQVRRCLLRKNSRRGEALRPWGPSGMWRPAGGGSPGHRSLDGFMDLDGWFFSWQNGAFSIVQNGDWNRNLS